MENFDAQKDFLSTLRARRSVYRLGRADISDGDLEEYLRSIFSSVPSAFNARAQRVLLLLGNQNLMFWKELVPDILRGRHEANPEDEALLAKREGLCRSFCEGNGTILFFTDSSVADTLRENTIEYASSIDRFMAQGDAMVEFAMWLGLSKIGLGASLQHFLGLGEAVSTAYDLDSSWKLDAQMPFGSIEKAPEPKDTAQAPEHFKVIK
ncbi:MAG: nitroreductase family protein [Aeriscardovia sp.]|nr:nitroreductase family protein [Aeriscardovia sp.]